MNERISPESLRRKLFIPLLFLFIVLICISNKTFAQGWSFTFQLSQSGPCQGSIPLPVLSLPNWGLPTKSQCESLRQSVIAIKESMPVYDNHGNYIGDCSLFYICTPCTGSDAVTSGQINPGEISFDGQFQGKPLFTTHESAAFEDWAKDYRQELESYGITSILGKNITPSQIPLTGNKNFDAFYNGQSADFNPKTPINTPSQDASVVDLSGKKGVVQLLTTTEEQKKRDDWYQKQLQNQGFDNLNQISTDKGISDIPIGSNWDLQQIQHGVFVVAGIAATATILLAAAPEVATVGVIAALGEEVGAATVISWALPVLEQGLIAAEACASGPCPTSGTIMTNMAVAQVSNVVGTVGQIASGVAAVATQQAIGTITTRGVNAVKYTWDVAFGAGDAGVNIWGLKK